MGITVLTLALASLPATRFLIPDHLSEEKVSVEMVGYPAKSPEGLIGHPIYQLVYKSGFRCGLRWKDGQAVPAYSPGIIPFYRNGRNGVVEKPSMCLKLKDLEKHQEMIGEPTL